MSSYLVIARKWRPALFEEIIGQDHVTRTLKNALGSGRIAHAYLFSGPRGVGKTTAARILAKGLNCAKGPAAVPCNECESCRGITTGSSVDVLEIDGASNTGVDNVRELRENVMYMPAGGKYKVYIIDEVHMLSTPAFNALLKTLEEPPPHVVFIFATTEVHKIPATILSRCQRFDFRRISLSAIQGHLEAILNDEGIVFDRDALYTIAREADGSLRDAQSLLDQVLAFGGGAVKSADVITALGLMDRSVLMALLRALVSGDGAGCLNIVEKIHNFGYDLKKACAEILARIRDLTILKTTGAGDLLEATDEELKELGDLAEGMGIERLHMLFSIISRGYEEVSRSAYPRYAFEMALLRGAHFDEVKPVAELVERLETLGRRLGVDGTGSFDRVSFDKGANQAPERPGKTPRQEEENAASHVPAGAGEDSAGYGGPEKDGGDVVEFIKRRNRALAGPLGSAVIELKGSSAEITVDNKNANFLRLKKGRLEEMLKDYYKRPVKVNIIAGNNAEPDKKKPDGLVTEVIRILGGRVIEDSYRGTNV
ncbi:MAG: hypothetical protein BMS9Abin23_0128 [Thermodesulfobacteriota bacterium]|nr:MAG: hypothetical protein BMS9Abin23_0128 [Thermodesulfobacteriota bacterium]